MRSLEADEQKKFVQYLKILERRGDILFFFAPINEDPLAFANRKKAFIVEQRSKAMGKRAGVSDLVIVLKRAVVFLELKRPPKTLKNGKKSRSLPKITAAQKAFLDKINESDVCHGYVAFGFDEAKSIIDLEVQNDRNE